MADNNNNNNNNNNASNKSESMPKVLIFIQFKIVQFNSTVLLIQIINRQQRSN